MRRLLILLAALLVTGCSATRFAYTNADVFLRWQAGRYLDLHGAQSEELDARIAAHRKSPRSGLTWEQVKRKMTVKK